MTFEQRLMLEAANAMLDAYGAMRKAARLLAMAGDNETGNDSQKIAEALDFMMQVVERRAKGAPPDGR